jgi:dihydrofolate reductase
VQSALAATEQKQNCPFEEQTEMRKLIVSEWMTLDGVVQAPISADEDTEGGFKHGGWHTPYIGDEVFQRAMTENITGAGGFLFGRRTYENFAAFWPNAPQDQQVIAQPLNTRPKYVASTTLAEPLAWQNSRLLQGSIAKAVTALKQEAGNYVLLFGSTKLLRTLIEHDLVDEFRLMIDPVVVGGGKRIFRDDGALRRLQLVDSKVTTTGAIIATYAPSRK